MTEKTTAQYWQVDELESVTQCPMCGVHSDSYLYQDLYDYLEGVPGIWNIRGCKGCKSLFMDPRPTREAIGKAYGTASYFTHKDPVSSNAVDNGDSLIWRLANGYLNHRFGANRSPSIGLGAAIIRCLPPVRHQLDYFYRHLPATPGRLLDVGCGNGSFLLRARDSGWIVEGIEPDPIAAERAANSGLEVHHGNVHSYAVQEARFDVITLSHVFEHLHNPQEVLDRCLGLLKPGGVLWMSMPNIEGVGHKLYKKAWFPLDPPRHLLLPSRHEVKRLCSDAGFTEVDLLDRGRSGSGLLRLSAQRTRELGGRARFDWFWILLSNVLSVVDPRYSDEMLVRAKKKKA